jgi:hypothetical protein
LKVLFDLSTTRDIGQGTKILFWYDNWAGVPMVQTFGSSYKTQQPDKRYAMQCANDYPTFSNGTTLNGSATSHIHMLVNAPQINNRGRDKLVWRWGSSSIYSAKLIYRVLTSAGKTKSTLSVFCKAKVTPSLRERTRGLQKRETTQHIREHQITQH